jgi:two-component system OmpR family response regulator
MCRVNGRVLPLTATEFRLLELLMLQAGQLIPRATLIASIWGAQSAISDRTLDSHLRNLRQKLAAVALADAIETRHGQGIRIGLPA